MNIGTSRPPRGGRRAALAALIAFGACGAPGAGGASAGEGAPRVVVAWAAATPPGAVTAAACLTMTSGVADSLVGARSSVSRGVELHGHVARDGMLRMTPIAALALEPGEPAVLTPGGHQLMLV